MNKLLSLTASALVLALLAACGPSIATETPDVTINVVPETPVPPSPSVTPEVLPILDVNVGEQSFFKQYRELNGALALIVELTFPRLDGNYPTCEVINGYYESELSNIAAYAEGELYDFAVSDYKQRTSMGLEFIPHTCVMNFTVEHNAEGYLSVTRVYSDYTGGAHDSAVMLADTFELSSGGRVPLGYLFTVGEEIYKKRIIGEVLRQIEAEKGSMSFPYFDNYSENIESTFDPECFYLTEDGLGVFYQVYSIAPYAAGIPRFIIPYAALEDIWKQ